MPGTGTSAAKEEKDQGPGMGSDTKEAFSLADWE
jgi:hypothetical protein